MNVKQLLEIIYSENSDVMMAYVQVSTSTKEECDLVLSFIAGLKYNEFNGKKVTDALKKIIGEETVSTIRFGREYSPVLYLTVHKFDFKTDKSLDAKGFNARLDKIKTEFKKLGAQEIHVEGEAPAQVRFWWD